ncbi:MAG: DUF4173 domain-containing protein, partial [Candidatus Magasanikbacteria bacterium]
DILDDVFYELYDLIPLVLLFTPIYLIFLSFRVKKVLQEYVRENIDVKDFAFSGLFTFLFTIIYLDYKMKKIYNLQKIHLKVKHMEENHKENREELPNFLNNDEYREETVVAESIEEKKLTVKDLFTENYSKLLKVRGLFIFFAFFVAGIGEILFLGETKGLGFLLFTIIYIAGFAGIAKITRQLRNYWAFGFAVPLLAFAVSSFLYTNRLVVFWVPVFSYILMILYPLFLTLQNPNKYRFSLSQIPIVRNVFLPLEKIPFLFRDLAQMGSVQMDPEKKNRIMKIGMGLLISIPILVIFGVLFYYADAVFADLAKRIFDYLDIDISWDDILKLIRIFIFGVALSALYYVFLSKNHILGNKNDKVFRLDDIIVSIVLSLVNLLFAVFVFIQFTYLFGKKEFVMANNMVFADYARSGFFQLVWVIILATIMLLVIYRSAVFHKARQIVNWLQVGLIAQVIMIGISAVRRMNVYQDAYGYTVLRIYVEWFIYFACVILFLALISIIIKWKFRYFLYSSIGLGFLAISLVTVTNIHFVVARENVNRFLYSGKALDVSYLGKLGFDAVTALEPLFKEENFKKLTIQNKVDLSKIFTNVPNYFTNETSKAVSYKYHAHNALRILSKYDTEQLQKQLDDAQRVSKEFEANKQKVFVNKNTNYCNVPSITKEYTKKNVECTIKNVGDKVYAIVVVNGGRDTIDMYADRRNATPLLVEYSIYEKVMNANVIDYTLIKKYEFEYELLDASKEKINDMYTKYDAKVWSGGDYHDVFPVNNFIMMKDGSFVELDEINKIITKYEIDITDGYKIKKAVY